MEIPVRDNPLDNIWDSMDLFSGMGKTSHACCKGHGAGIPVAICPKSSMGWNVTVRDDYATQMRHRKLTTPIGMLCSSAAHGLSPCSNFLKDTKSYMAPHLLELASA